MPALGGVMGWHGVPDGVVGTFDCDVEDVALPGLLVAGVEVCAAELGGFAPAGLFAGFVATPGPDAVAVVVVEAEEFALAGHGTIGPAFGPGFGEGLFCCVPVGGVVAVGGAGVCDASGPAAFVVMGVGGPIVVAGTAVVPCWGAALAGGAACVGAAAAGAGVAGVGGAVVALCATAHVAVHNTIASVAIRFVMTPPAELEKMGSWEPDVENKR